MRRALLLLAVLALAHPRAHADPQFSDFTVSGCIGGPQISGSGALIHTINPHIHVLVSTNNSHGGGVLAPICGSNHNIPALNGSGGLQGLSLQAAWDFEGLGSGPVTAPDISGSNNDLDIFETRNGAATDPTTFFSGVAGAGQALEPVDSNAAHGNSLWDSRLDGLDISNSDFTIEMWFKLHSLADHCNDTDANGANCGESEAIMFSQHCPSIFTDCNCAYLSGGIPLWIINGVAIIGSAAVAADEPHHIAFRLQSGSATIVMDGRPLHVTNLFSKSTTTWDNTTAHFHIGNSLDVSDSICNDRYTDGLIDNVRIYLTALSNGTLQAHYRQNHFKIGPGNQKTNQMDGNQGVYVCEPAGATLTPGDHATLASPGTGNKDWVWEFNGTFQSTAGANNYQFTATDENERIGATSFSLTVDQSTMTIPPAAKVTTQTITTTSIEWVVPTWFCDTGSTNYRWALTDYGGDFTSESYVEDTQTSKTRNETGLEANHRYSQTVAAKYKDDGTGGSNKSVGFSEPTSEVFGITLAAVPLDPAGAFTPNNGSSVQMLMQKGGVVDTNPTWTALSIEGSRDLGANWNIVAPFVAFDTPATHRRSATGLQFSSRYRFRSRAANLEGKVTGPSSVTTGTGDVFVTQPETPPPPTGNANLDTVVSQSPPFNCPKTTVHWTWPAIPIGSIGSPYQSNQADYTLFSHFPDGSTTNLATLTNVGATSVTPFFDQANLAPNTQYGARLKATDSDPSSFGPGVPFPDSFNSSTGTALTAPLTIPAIFPVNPTPLSPTSVKWDWARPDALCPPFQYVLKDPVSGGTVTTLGDGIPTPPGSTPRPPPSFTQTQDVLGSPLGINQFVSLTVQTIDSPPSFTPNSGPASPVAAAYTQANAPSALTGTVVTTNSLTMTWSGAGNPGYTRYELGISDTDFGVNVSSPVTIPANYTTTSKLIGGLLDATTYYFSVRAKNGRNEDNFGTVLTPITQFALQTLPLTPGLSVTPGNGVLNWNWGSVPRATSYQLFDAVGGTLFTEQPYGGSFFQAVGGPNVPAGAQIKARNVQALGNLSQLIVAYTNANPPTGPAITAVSSNTISYSLGANGNPGYTFFEVSVATDATFGVVLTTRVFTGTSTTVDGLFPGTTYFSRVRAISGSQIPTAFVNVPGQGLTSGDPAVSLSTAPESPYSVSSNIVGLWHFDESTGTTASDSSVYHNDAAMTCLLAACTSTPTFTAGPPFLARAGHFSGLSGSLVRAVNQPQYNFGGGITVSAWAKSASAAMPAAGGTILAKGMLNAESFDLDVVGSRYRFRVQTGLGVRQAVSTQSVRISEWDHVAGTYNAATGRIAVFVNGVLSSQDTSLPGSPRTVNARPLTIGSRESAVGVFDLSFQGDIDDARVVSGLLTDVEVRDLYAVAFPHFINLPAPNDGVCLSVPPDAFGASALFYASSDPMNHPLHAGVQTLANGLQSTPTGQVLVPDSLIEIVPTVGGLPFTDPLGSVVTLCLPYTDSNDDGIVDGSAPPIPVSTLKVYTLDTTVVRWQELPSTIEPLSRHVFAQTPHFSLFALFGANSIGNVIDEIHVYPAPWRKGSGTRFDAPNLTFDRLPQDGTVRIVTLAGERVKDILFSGSDSGTIRWDGTNEHGRNVASGVYFALVRSRSGKEKILKFAIER